MHTENDTNPLFLPPLGMVRPEPTNSSKLERTSP
jgi:hypothetical protein